MEAGAMPRMPSPRLPVLSPRLIRLASDVRLVALVREGRVGAFETLYDRYQRGILAFCRHMLGDQHEAEDAVQHTFMAAYTSLLASQQPIHLRPWLFAIARNRCYSVLRSQRERPTGELEEPVTDGLAAEVQRRQDLRDLVMDLSRLPDDQRAAIVLAELESLSHAEIAQVLCVPREKVKALVFQARESLMASRTARDTTCHEIQQQLALGRGGALRRSNLRRHLRDCEGCQAYRAQVQRQRRQFAALLPVAPTLLLKEGLLPLALGAGGAAAVGGSGLIVSSTLKTGFLKSVAAAVIAGAGTLGTVVVSAGDGPLKSLAGTGGAATRSHARGRHGASAPRSASSELQSAVGQLATTAATGAVGQGPLVAAAGPSAVAGGSRVDHASSGGAPAGVSVVGGRVHRAGTADGGVAPAPGRGFGWSYPGTRTNVPGRTTAGSHATEPVSRGQAAPHVIGFAPASGFGGPEGGQVGTDASGAGAGAAGGARFSSGGASPSRPGGWPRPVARGDHHRGAVHSPGSPPAWSHSGGVGMEPTRTVTTGPTRTGRGVTPSRPERHPGASAASPLSPRGSGFARSSTRNSPRSLTGGSARSATRSWSRPATGGAALPSSQRSAPSAAGRPARGPGADRAPSAGHVRWHH